MRKWTREQAAAIAADGGNLLVTAAAGSGKTSVLTERVIRRVTQGEARVDLDRLLVVTFTKAAAGEMRERIGARLVPGALFSSDTFYDESNPNATLQKLGVLAVEMEAAALYLNAARAGKQALALCTISDNPFTGEGLSAKERQESFREMMEIALEIAL